ncbi:transposase, partial [Serratia marcescens]|nr:transposase [Serratia marcescens]
TVKNIDYRRLLWERTEPQRHTLRRLVMDEFALFKGHRYATVVMDADTQQVLWVGEGSRAAFRPSSSGWALKAVPLSSLSPWI